jgi:hypothetical protein
VALTAASDERSQSAERGTTATILPVPRSAGLAALPISRCQLDGTPSLGCDDLQVTSPQSLHASANM